MASNIRNPMMINPDEIPQEYEEISVLKHHFRIHYAFYFNYATTSNHSPSKHPISDRLIPISTCMKICNRKGAWLASSSTASLCLFTNTTQSLLALVVNLHGSNIEEHFVSNLHFSWPQISCASQRPVRGSRVIFASYKDSMGQMQKFAMRFLSSSDSQSFINALLESLNMQTVGTSINNFLPGIQQYDFIALDELHKRAAVEQSTGNQAVNDNRGRLSSVNGKDYAFSEEKQFSDVFGSTQGDIPPSFTAFLTERNTESQEEPLKVPLEADLFSYLVKHMSGSAFRDMLGMLEKFISDAGRDSVLQVS